MLAIGEVLPDGEVSKNVESFMTTKKYLVVSPHESEFPKPIRFKKGICLSLVKNIQELKTGITGSFAARQGNLT